MVKKVGIITLTGSNYGNRLQNYATQLVIEQMGFIVETFHNPFVRNYSYPCEIAKNIIKLLVGNKKKKNEVRREFQFKKFDKKYIKYSKYWLNNDKHIGKLNSIYDYFLCGSDQVWNPMTDNYGTRNFASFAEKNKRITMAPSFGVEEIPTNKKEIFKKMLNDFKYLSVREKSGAYIIKSLTNRDSTVVIDPTLMIDADKWRDISSRPSWMLDEKYILVYCLGDLYFNNWLSSLSNEYGYKIINIMDKNLEFYAINPSHFVYLIEHCELMVTDSFHGSVFSLLFDRPFVVMERKDQYVSMNTRLDNLLSLFNLNDRKFHNIDKDKLFCHNYEEAYNILEHEREKALNFLRVAFQGENNEY